jgi:hypothetical protein
MALTNYTGLVQTVQDYLVQEDISTDNVGTFIELCEAKLNRELRHMLMIESQVGDIPALGLVPLPGGFIEISNHSVGGSVSVAPEYIPPNDLALMRQNMPTGQPRYYTLSVLNFFNAKIHTVLFAPLPADTHQYNIQYYSELPGLSPIVTTNWLLDKYPDVYLYGCLLEAAPFLIDDSRLQTWSTLFEQSKASVMKVSQRAQSRPAARMHTKSGIRERRGNARY